MKAYRIWKGEIFGHIPVSIDLTLEDEDSPNSGGVTNDAIRAAQSLVENKQAQEAKILCAFLMKSPPKQFSDTEALDRFKSIIKKLK